MHTPLENLRAKLRVTDTLQRLLILNISLFLFLRITNAISGLFLTPVFGFEDVSEYLSIPANIRVLITRPWSVITYMFFHWDIGHILFNMLWLYWMGRIFQEYLGSKKLLNTYLMGGLAGALFFIAAYNFFPRFTEVLPGAFALGASASVLAITIATATLLPEYRIQLLFFGSIPLKWIAVFTVLLDLISVSGSNAGGHIAHLGGAFYGYIYIRRLQKGKDISAWLTHLIDRFTSRRKTKATPKKKRMDEDYNIDKKAKQERMDEILDKISKSGYGSLSQQEKDFLFRVSKED